MSIISDLSSYALQDFLMFSQDALIATITKYNQTLWPWQFFLAAVFLFFCFCLWQKKFLWVWPFVLAPAWLFLGIAFYYYELGSIFWAHQYFASFCLVQALLCGFLGFLKAGHSTIQSGRYLALLCLAGGLFPYNFLVDDKWQQYTFFGTGSSATAIVTLLFVGLGLRKTYPLLWFLLLPAPLILLFSNFLILWAKG